MNIIHDNITFYITLFSSNNFLPIMSLVLVLLSITYQWLVKATKSNNKPRRPPLPPGPKPWPVVGSLPEIHRKRPVFRWIHGLMDEMKTEIACIRLGGKFVIPVTSPELACEFLKTQDSVFSSRPLCMSADVISNGFLTSIFLPSGDRWMRMRRILSSHVLSPARTHWLHDKRLDEANHLVKYIYNQCNNKCDDGAKGIVNMRAATRYYCGNVTKRIIFNKRNLCDSEREDEEFVETTLTLLKYLYRMGISDFAPRWLSIFDIDGHKRMMKKALDVTRKHIDREVDKRIEMRKHGNGSTEEEEEDILDVLVMLKDEHGTPLLSDLEIKTQVLEMLLASIDNPSNAVEWAMAEMLNQPKLLEKAIEEIDNVVGKDRLVEESDFPKLNYIKACIKEAFRLHPVAPFNIPHVSFTDTIVCNGRYFIPKGSHVLLSRPGLGRNPRAWADPLEFRPERHLGEGGEEVILNDIELKLLSFGVGRRGCPGVRLGSLTCTMLMARLVQCFTWSVPYDLSHVDLTESEDNLLLKTPLFAVAKPRLSKNLYF